MSGTKTLLVSDGANKRWMTQREYAELMARTPKSQRNNYSIAKGKVNTAYQNRWGEWVRDNDVSHESVVNRMNIGEQPVITGAQDPKLQAMRSAEQAEVRREIGDNRNALALMQASPMGLALAPMQNLAMGTDQATAMRTELFATNPVVSGTVGLGSAIALTAGGAHALGFAKLGQGLGALGTLVRGVGMDAAVTAYLHGKHLLDYNQPFVAENFAADMMVSMYTALPFLQGPVLMAGGRRALSAGVRAARTQGTLMNTAGKGLMEVGDAFVGGALAMGNGNFTRYGAVAKIFGRWAQRNNKLGMAKGTRQATAQAERAFIETLSPDKVAKLSSRQWDNFVQQLDEVTTGKYEWERPMFEGMTKNINDTRLKLDQARKEANWLLNNAGTPRIGKVTKEANEFYQESARRVADLLADSDYAEVAGLANKLAGQKMSRATYGQWLRLRMQSRLGVGVTPGAAEADDLIREFVEDFGVWGQETAGTSVRINKAWDRVARSYDSMDTYIPQKDLTKVSQVDVDSVKNMQGALDDVRAGYNTLREEGVIPPKKAIALESRLREVERQVGKGEQGLDAARQVNEAYADAVGTHRARFGPPDAQNPVDTGADAVRKVVDQTSDFAHMAKAVMHMATTYSTLPGVTMHQILLDITSDERVEITEYFQEVLSQMVTQPMVLEERLNDAQGALSATSPTLGMEAGTRAANATYYLAGKMPKTRYGGGGDIRPPNRTEANHFVETLIGAIYPSSVAWGAIDGRVTQSAIDAVRNIYPAYYAEVANVIADAMRKSDTPYTDLPRQRKKAIDKFLGGMDPLYTGESIVQLQSNYAQTELQQQVMNPAAPKIQGTFAADNIQRSNNFTGAQRASQ